MISPQLVALAQAEGFDIEHVPSGTLIEVKTQNDTFWLLVVDPQQGRIVLESTHRELQKPMVFNYQGATSGGSAVKLGCMAVGFRMRMNPAEGGILTTSTVRSIEFPEDPERAARLAAADVEDEQRPTMSEEEFVRRVQETIDKEFPEDRRERIRVFVAEFNSEGQGIMLGIMSRAHAVGKLDQALEILDKDFKEHWGRRPPFARGSFITEQDVHYVERAYQQLGLPSPQQG